jgi:hypothetical protein
LKLAFNVSNSMLVCIQLVPNSPRSFSTRLLANFPTLWADYRLFRSSPLWYVSCMVYIWKPIIIYFLSAPSQQHYLKELNKKIY